MLSVEWACLANNLIEAKLNLLLTTKDTFYIRKNNVLVVLVFGSSAALLDVIISRSLV